MEVNAVEVQGIWDEEDEILNSAVESLLWAQLGVRLSQVNRGGENTRSRYLVLWSRNHEYSSLTWND